MKKAEHCCPSMWYSHWISLGEILHVTGRDPSKGSQSQSDFVLMVAAGSTDDGTGIEMNFSMNTAS